MSYSTLYSVYRTKVTRLREYRNGHGTGPAIWGHLLEKHLNRNRYSFGDDMGPLWDLARDSAVPLCLRACHVFTFDHAVIRPDAVKEMAKLLAEGGAIIGEGRSEYANHFPAIAADLESLKLNARSIGVGLSCTSVSDPWQAFTRQQPFDCWGYINKQPGKAIP